MHYEQGEKIGPLGYQRGYTTKKIGFHSDISFTYKKLFGIENQQNRKYHCDPGFRNNSDRLKRIESLISGLVCPIFYIVRVQMSPGITSSKEELSCCVLAIYSP